MTAVTRIAFLTPEYPTEVRAGGLSQYLARTAAALRRIGADPEIFVLAAADHGEETIDHDGVLVHRVRPVNADLLGIPRWARCLAFVQGWLRSAPGRLRLDRVGRSVRGAAALARALDARHLVRPFQAIQSSDFGLAGLFVRQRAGLARLVRSSSPTEIYRSLNGERLALDHLLLSWMERRMLASADMAYAPSALTAGYYRRYGIRLDVVRPPFFIDASPANGEVLDAPSRFLFHWGNLGPVKGTDVLAAALPLVWREEPKFTMVWAGAVQPTFPMKDWVCRWGVQAERVQYRGLIDKGQVYGLLQRCVAAVAPSRCDNLPNAVLESIGMGKPVIGAHGASIDEMIRHGVDGELTPIGDVASLAQALLNAWRGMPPFDGRVVRPPILDEMEPSTAARRLLTLAELSVGAKRPTIQSLVGEQRGASA